MKELVQIQSELKAPKNQKNKFGGYMYRSCEDILEGLKTHLLSHDCYITLADDVQELGGVLMIKATATITNSEGKSVSVSAYAGVDPNKKGMDISQTFGSSSSYARKYALNGLFAIDDTKDADTQDNTPSKTNTTSTGTTANKGTKPKTKGELKLGSPAYNVLYEKYRDARSNQERNNVKSNTRNHFSNAEEVLTEIENKYKEYLEAKNK